MQSEGGGWGAFDVDNTGELPLKLPFCDFGAVTDPPSADVTAHMVELLGVRGPRAAAPARARARLPAARAGARRLVVRPLGREPPLRHRRRRARARGVRHARSPGRTRRNAVAGRRSERGRRLRRGHALLPRCRLARARRVDCVADRLGAARLDAAGVSGPAVDRAVEWLVETQRPEGGWDEPQYTGTGFPGDFYLNYHLYRDVFPVMALGRILGERR